MENKLSFFEKLKVYRLINSVYILAVLLIITVLSICLYLVPNFRSNAVFSDIMLAVFTSLMASIVSISAEVVVQYKAAQRDRFLKDIHAFGITNLNKNKQDALRLLLKDCHRELWISGYRLIMTAALSEDIESALLKHKIKTRVMLCPPWEDAYKMVYGENPCIDNYYKVLFTIWDATKNNRDLTSDDIEIRFVDKPLFSDTYRVDSYLISGPYMHNKNDDNSKMTAKDFFSYNLTNSPLYQLVDDEFEDLWDEASHFASIEDFGKIYKEYSSDMSDEEKKALLQSITQKLESPLNV